MKIEGGTVFLNESSQLKDILIYDATVVIQTPKDAVWSQEYAKDFLNRHTDGDVKIVMCHVMNQHGYAEVQKKQGEAHAALDKLGEMLKSAAEEAMSERKESKFKRFLNKLKGEAK